MPIFDVASQTFLYSWQASTYSISSDNGAPITRQTEKVNEYSTLSYKVNLNSGSDNNELMSSAVSGCSDELNRLLSAAVVNQEFCRKLLATPLKAIKDGYCGYVFDLPPNELQTLASLSCVSLDDFARQLLSQPVNRQDEPTTSYAVEVEIGVVDVMAFPFQSN